MSSKKQRKANRKNGRKGGVKTPEGKAISKWNAITHAFRAADVVLPWEDPKDYERHCQAILRAIQPFCALSFKLSLKICENLWRLDRTGGAEKRAYLKANCRKELHKELAEISKYESRLNRDNDRAIKQITKLMKLEAERRKLGLPDMSQFNYIMPKKECKNDPKGWIYYEDMPYDEYEGSYWRAHLDDVILATRDYSPSPQEEESVKRRMGDSCTDPYSLYQDPQNDRSLPPRASIPQSKDISSVIIYKNDENDPKTAKTDEKGLSKNEAETGSGQGSETQLGSFVKNRGVKTKKTFT